MSNYERSEMDESLHAGTGYSEQATRAVPDRESIVKEFEWAISELRKVTEELFVRLGPVLRPSSPLDSAKEIGPMMSDARSRLLDLQATTADLRNLIERLEV